MCSLDILCYGEVLFIVTAVMTFPSGSWRTMTQYLKSSKFFQLLMVAIYNVYYMCLICSPVPNTISDNFILIDCEIVFIVQLTIVIGDILQIRYNDITNTIFCLDLHLHASIVTGD